MGTEFGFGLIKVSWRWMVTMVVQQCECSNAPELYTKMVMAVNILLYILYHSKWL